MGITDEQLARHLRLGNVGFDDANQKRSADPIRFDLKEQAERLQENIIWDLDLLKEDDTVSITFTPGAKGDDDIFLSLRTKKPSVFDVSNPENASPPVFEVIESSVAEAVGTQLEIGGTAIGYSRMERKIIEGMHLEHETKGDPNLRDSVSSIFTHPVKSMHVMRKTGETETSLLEPTELDQTSTDEVSNDFFIMKKIFESCDSIVNSGRLDEYGTLKWSNHEYGVEVRARDDKGGKLADIITIADEANGKVYRLRKYTSRYNRAATYTIEIHQDLKDTIRKVSDKVKVPSWAEYGFEGKTTVKYNYSTKKELDGTMVAYVNKPPFKIDGQEVVHMQKIELRKTDSSPQVVIVPETGYVEDKPAAEKVIRDNITATLDTEKNVLTVNVNNGKRYLGRRTETFQLPTTFDTTFLNKVLAQIS